MIRTLLALASACLMALPALASGNLVETRLASPALGRDLPYAVYLPAAARDAARRFPVVFLLHGYGAGYRQWIEGGDIARSLDDLIASGSLPPMIAVMPDAANSWYVDSARYGGPGDYETAIVRDLVREVDALYPTQASRGTRAIAGLSMGGFGALRLAFRHPATFGAVAGMSPAIWKPGAVSWTHGPATMEPSAAAAKFLRTTGPGFDAAVLAAQAPFAHVGEIAARSDAPDILLTVGDDDYFSHYDGTTELFLDLRAAGLKPELRVSDGGHNWAHWRPMAREVFGFLAAVWSRAPAH